MQMRLKSDLNLLICWLSPTKRLVESRTAKFSETVIGLTIVAIGTSLPGLVTSAIAACREQRDVAHGNVIGSNILNKQGILGIPDAVASIPVPQEIARFYIRAATAALIAVAVTAWRVQRGEGFVPLTAYAAYAAYLAALLTMTSTT